VYSGEIELWEELDREIAINIIYFNDDICCYFDFADIVKENVAISNALADLNLTAKEESLFLHQVYHRLDKGNYFSRKLAFYTFNKLFPIGKIHFRKANENYPMDTFVLNATVCELN
jgi:hypothetical protein